jgi:SAM-dependent methyltransferase
MTDWTAGYVADIGYTFGYYQELNPLRARLAFLNAGLVPPDVGTHCELGFGQGISANMHAAATPHQWFATDFNPSQAGFAQSLSCASGAKAALYDESFAEFCSRSDLPDFDSIGLHGIWSWISDENRTIIVDFVRRKLKVGGVLYISYNTQPGWAAMTPMRDLLTEHNESMGISGNGIVNRINGALDFAERLFATNPNYLKANPAVADRLKGMKSHNRNYLAHEYFNRDWLPMPFSKMAQWLAPAKLNFACSADYLGHVNAINLTSKQQVFLAEIPDPMFRQSVYDFMLNQQFRKDYWVKGPRKLTQFEKVEALRLHKVILVEPRADISLKVSGALGMATMHEDVYGPILDTLADHQPKSLIQIEQLLVEKSIELSQITEAVVMLMGIGALSNVQDDVGSAAAQSTTDRLNAYLTDKSRGNFDVSYLASPVTGGGIAVTRLQQLFLLALRMGQSQPSELAQTVWNILEPQGQKVKKENLTLETAEENLSELTSLASTFIQKKLPIFQALKII